MNEGTQEQQQQVHPAAVAQEFLKRTEMKGGEVEAYTQTFNWLSEFLSGGLIILTKADFESVQKDLEELRVLKASGVEGEEVPVLESEEPSS